MKLLFHKVLISCGAKKKVCFLSLFLMTGSVLFLSGATAQTPPADFENRARTLSPGQAIQDLQQKTVPSFINPPVLKKRPSDEVKDAIPEPAAPQPGENIKRIYINSIQVMGAKLLSPQEVALYVRPYENHRDSFADLQTLADSLTNLYRDKGYVTSRVYIPPQHMQNNILKLQALEGTTGHIDIEDGRYFKAYSIRSRLLIKPREAFNLNDLKLSLRRLNDNPDRNVRAVLKPGDDTGQTDINVSIVDRFPFHLTPGFDNLGRYSTGNNRVGLKIGDNNLLGLGDTFLSSLSFTRKSFGIVDNYNLPIGSHGTYIGLSQAYSYIKVGGPLGGANIKGSAFTYSPTLTQEFINKESYKFYGDIAFDIKHQSQEFGGTQVSHANLRIIRPALNYEEYDRKGRLTLRGELEVGSDWFGANTFGTTRLGAKTQFSRYSVSAFRTQFLPWNSFAIFKLLGQVTPDRLISSEQFQLGGAFTIRGYKEGRVISDQGLLASAEWRVPAYFFPPTWHIPHTQYRFRDNVQVVSFIDSGLASTFDTPANVGRRVTAAHQQLLGAGLGLRFVLTRLLSGRFDVGFPIIHVAGDQFQPHIYFGLESALY